MDAASGQLFSTELTLSHSGSMPVQVYTNPAGTTFSSVTWHSIYIQKTSGGYEIMESKVLDNNKTFAASAIDPRDAFRIQVPDSVADQSDTIVGGENHAHTEAYVDGRWIVMDATWDSNNEYRGGTYITKAPNGFYYFDITPEAFALDHKTTSRDQKDYVVADDGLGISADGKTLISYRGSGGHVVIPEGVTEIAMGCFEKCTTLTGVTFPSTLTTIGKNAYRPDLRLHPRLGAGNRCERLLRVR